MGMLETAGSQYARGGMAENVFFAVQRFVSRTGISLRPQVPLATQKRLFDAMRPVATEHQLVRLGGDGDGGYLVPDDFAGIEACFSPGVDVVASFENDIVARGIPTFQCDASVAESPLKHPLNRFERKFLGLVDDDETLTLDSWVEVNAPGNSDLLLQMDIEGGEWISLASVSEKLLQRFRIIVVELHYLDRALESFGAKQIIPVLERLHTFFDVVHLHANNYSPLVPSRHFEIPPTVEMTLLRKDRSRVREPISQLPHPLDRNCIPGKSAVDIPKAMYGA